MLEELNGDFLQWLRGFYYIAQTGSVRGAAEMMNRNPSTISYQLKSLEHELDAVLFDRHKNGLRITSDGKRLLEWTITTFENLRSMRAEVGSAAGALQGVVAMSTSFSIAVQTVPMIASFQKNNPKVRIKIRKALAAGVVEDVESSRVDFGMIGLTSLSKGCVFEELFQTRPLLVVQKTNSYNLPDQPGPEDLERLPQVYFLSNELDETGDPFLGNPLLPSYVGRPVLGVNNFYLMLQYVHHGLGAAVIDEACLAANTLPEDQTLAVYPLDSFLPCTRYGILVRKHKHLGPQTRELIACIRAGLKKPDAMRVETDRP